MFAQMQLDFFFAESFLFSFCVSYPFNPTIELGVDFFSFPTFPLFIIFVHLFLTHFRRPVFFSILPELSFLGWL